VGLHIFDHNVNLIQGYILKAIAVHTFVVVMWGLYKHRYSIAYTVVGITWLFLAILIVVNVTAHNHEPNIFYTPVGVCFIAYLLFANLKLIMCRDSIGAGLATITTKNGIVANMPGLCSPCLCP
jgi:hypothetical protein